jgi:hypothetical protein
MLAKVNLQLPDNEDIYTFLQKKTSFFFVKLPHFSTFAAANKQTWQTSTIIYEYFSTKYFLQFSLF